MNLTPNEGSGVVPTVVDFQSMMNRLNTVLEAYQGTSQAALETSRAALSSLEQAGSGSSFAVSPNMSDLKHKVKPTDIPVTTPLTEVSSYVQFVEWEEFMISTVMEYAVTNPDDAKEVWARRVPVTKALTDFLDALISKNVSPLLKGELLRAGCNNFYDALVNH